MYDLAKGGIFTSRRLVVLGKVERIILNLLKNLEANFGNLDMQITDYIPLLFDSFLELHGDRKSGDDKAIIGGLARLDKYKVVVIGYKKTQLVISPAGYRKCLRLLNLAESFNKPVVAFIDAVDSPLSKTIEQQQINEAMARYMEKIGNIMTPSIGITTSREPNVFPINSIFLDRVIFVENNISDNDIIGVSNKLKGEILKELDQLTHLQPEFLFQQRLNKLQVNI